MLIPRIDISIYNGDWDAKMTHRIQSGWTALEEDGIRGSV